MILSKLISNPTDFGTYASPCVAAIRLDGDNHRFDYFQGSHVPLIYHSQLEREEKKTAIPFTDHFKSEWNNTFEYQPSVTSTIDFFINSDRQRSTGQFYTQASHRGRSAYLRTISVAKQFYGMPASYAEHLSLLALPIEPAYIGLNPQKPGWLPDWEYDSAPTQENLTQFVEGALADFSKAEDYSELLSLSLPIKFNTDSWIDLTIVRSLADEVPATGTRIQERLGCFSIGNRLDATLSYIFTKKEHSNEAVSAVTAYPTGRHGHWHSNLESRGLYIPNCEIDGKDVIGSTVDGLFCFSVDGTKIGSASYWNTQWQPNHPKGIRSLSGTATKADTDELSKWSLPRVAKTVYYNCNATILQSGSSHLNYDTSTHEFIVCIEVTDK